MNTIEGRIERLERQNRRLRQLGTLLALIVAAPLILAATEGKPTAIEADKFVLRDGDGAARAVLEMKPDGTPALTLYDARQQGVLKLHAAGVGPRIEMADGKGGSLWLGSTETGSSVVFAKEKGEVQIAVDASGLPRMRMTDDDGEQVWTAP